MQSLKTAFGDYRLERIPHDPTHTLRAWDAADEYLLDYLYQHHLTLQQPLILNDGFGALGVSLHQQQPTLINDSFVSQQALLKNLERNDITAQPELLDSLSPIPARPIVIIKLPKTAAYFEYQLKVINHYLPPGTPIVIGAMVKYLSATFFKLMENHLEDVQSTLARKKARLISATIRGDYPAPELIRKLELPEQGLSLYNTPNLFSSGKLDIGSRFFLTHFPDLHHAHEIIDLGCGNGLLGITALKNNPRARVTFVDESYHAIHATKASAATLKNSGISGEQLTFQVNHCLQGFAKNAADTVLCNPPFHQQQSVGIHIARQMFCDSAHVLRPKGTLYIIGNRHLGYHLELRKYFEQVKVIASDRKFVMLSATA